MAEASLAMWGGSALSCGTIDHGRAYRCLQHYAIALCMEAGLRRFVQEPLSTALLAIGRAAVGGCVRARVETLD